MPVGSVDLQRIHVSLWKSTGLPGRRYVADVIDVVLVGVVQDSGYYEARDPAKQWPGHREHRLHRLGFDSVRFHDGDCWRCMVTVRPGLVAADMEERSRRVRTSLRVLLGRIRMPQDYRDILTS